MYWAARLSEGMTLRQIADSFFSQPETASVYSPTLSTREFVTAAYQNVFGRVADAGGLDYWVHTLDAGTISKGWFLYTFLQGATEGSTDDKIATNKETVALNFATAQGLSNSVWGRTALAGVNETPESVKVANDQIAEFAAIAANPATAELVVKLIGIV